MVRLQEGAELQFRLAERKRRAEPEVVRVPRVSRRMAQAIELERLEQQGQLADTEQLTEWGLNRAGLGQILCLRNLAPAIQEELLFLPPVLAERDRRLQKRLQEIARVVEWGAQQALFAEVMSEADY